MAFEHLTFKHMSHQALRGEEEIESGKLTEVTS